MLRCALYCRPSCMLHGIQGPSAGARRDLVLRSEALSMVLVQCDTLPPHAVSALLSACSASSAPASEALALLL